MAERSRERSNRSPFSRGRLVVGILLVAVVGAGVAYGLGRLRGGPDPGRVVYANEHGVYVRELATGEQKRVARLPSDTLEVWPDKTGRWVAYLRRRGDLSLLDLRTGARWPVADRDSAGLGWTPDDRFVAVELASDGDLVAIDPRDRGIDLLGDHILGSTPVWLDPSGFLTTVVNKLVIVDVGDRSRVRGIADEVRLLAVAPGGSQVMYATSGTAQPRVRIADLEGRDLRNHRTVFEGTAYRAAVSPQGFVAFSGRDRSDEGGTWVLRGGARSPRRISKEQAESIAWTSDGSALVYVIDGALYARELRDDRTLRLSERGTYVKGFAVVP